MTHWIHRLRALLRHRRPADTAARDKLKAQYYNFKSLLTLNERALSDMSDLQQKLSNGRSFGMPFVRSRATSMSVLVYQIIETLNRMSDGRHRDLLGIFDALQADIHRLLEDSGERAEGPLVVSMEQVSKKDAGLVGPKMAVLGEITQHIHPLVPDGFVITTVAARVFMSHEGLCGRINQLHQAMDPENMADVHETSDRIRRLIAEAPLPQGVETAIRDACARVRLPRSRAGLLAVRSSALGEDTQEHSFAGLYDTELNVTAADVPQVYRRILASKYSARAMVYREKHGLRDDQIHMGVGCLSMVPAAGGGVMYSRDPRDVTVDRLIINAAAGSGSAVVDGRVSPEHVEVEKSLNGRWVLARPAGAQQIEGGSAFLTREVILKLAKLARRLENHFHSPQDIEWAVTAAGEIYLLQSRPLKGLPDTGSAGRAPERRQPDRPSVLQGGQTASRGVGWGIARLVRNRGDMESFRDGDVLVVEHALPRWTPLLKKAAAVVADTGGIVGHLATVAREFAVPMLVDVRTATRLIPVGGVITVDADQQTVYAGKVEALLETRMSARPPEFCASPVYHTLKRVMEKIAPLNLLDPTDGGFQSKRCETYHDIVRFCHEKAIEELFAFGSRRSSTRNAGKKLVAAEMPVGLWILRLDDEPLSSARQKTVCLEEVDSLPFSAFWNGVTAVPWDGPPAPDAKGLLSVMAESTMNPELEAGAAPRLAGGNVAFVTRQFCSISLRWGYHLSLTQAFWGASSRENYARFSFQGGAADRSRRDLRIKLIASLLEAYGFQVREIEDHLTARLEGCDGEAFGRRIQLLGYVNIHACQIDMIMGNPARIRRCREKMHQDAETIIFRS
jgi:pyruvate, water dikinase